MLARVGLGWTKPDVEAEVLRQHEGAAAVAVVAVPDVVDGGLGRAGLERRVAIDQSCSGMKPGVGHTPDTEAPVVPRQVLQHPLDTVVGIAAFVHIGVAALDGNLRPHFDPLALGRSGAHVLADEDIAALQELVRFGECSPPVCPRHRGPQPWGVRIISTG